ncbi:hypothetical protein UlMin_004404 [Ulmus minor]
MSKVTDVAFKGNFEFRTIKSTKSLWVVQCVDPNCKWRLHESKTVPESNFFVIKKYVGVHSCSLLSRNTSHRQATYIVVGEQVASQFLGAQKGPAPKSVQSFGRTHLKAKISYYKAWRGRKHAQSLIRGSPEESFYKLPSYFYMLEKVNPDGNSKCYPIAWGIVDSENEDSWTWFLRRLREVIGDTDKLVFISDRAQSIKKAISIVYDRAQHGARAWHVAQNVKSKFRCGDMMGTYWKAVDVYTVEEFGGYMSEISQRYPRVAEYLEREVGFEKWSRCHFSGMRYNITTTNMVESLNSMLLEAKEYLYIALINVIQEKMSKWWNMRREMSMSLTSPLTPKREDEIRPRFTESNSLLTQKLNPVTFHVKGPEVEAVVDTHKMSCTCRAFDIDILPYVHAIAATHHTQNLRFHGTIKNIYRIPPHMVLDILIVHVFN